MTDAPRARPRQVVSWFELFYDLVIVAAIGHGTRVFGAEPTWGTGVVIASAVLVLFSAWLLTSLHHGAFPGDDPVRRILVLVQMAALAIAALSVGDRALPTDAGFGALAAVLVSIAVMWGRTLVRDRASAPLTAPIVAGTLAGAALILVAALLPGDGAVVRVLAVAGVLAAVLPLLTVFLGRAVRVRAIDPHHLEERLATLVLVVLGESFADLIGSLAGIGGIPSLPFFLLTFAVVFAIWTMYAASVVDGGLPETARGLRAWLGAHALLGYGAIAVAASFADLTLVPFGEGGFEERGPWTTIPLAYVVTALALLAFISRAPQGIRLVHLVTIALLVAFAVIGLVAPGIPDGALIALGGALVIVDASIVAGIRRRASPPVGARP